MSLYAFSLQADDSAATANAVEATEQVNEEQTGERELNESIGTNQEGSPPQAENLKNRKLGTAFRRFRPSEEISADNAVPFPVDI